ncbi:integral membrane transport protein [Streptomyces sp. D2-8]|uniref:integral membrane transport protein n=1 Tax=Streptomyces sp. D2-8 TaxID=2707767 RepID=UPI0020BFB115|nr:integral membrane transport protein [Streptomyces sp. D2-8]MCK8435385.1 integral membrane transport protein [Streptomyces sp. D2-8]
MSAVTDTVRVAPATNPVSQSIRDSMVVAQRNLIRMSRIPNPVRSYRPGSISLRTQDRRTDTSKEQVK